MGNKPNTENVSFTKNNLLEEEISQRKFRRLFQSRKKKTLKLENSRHQGPDDPTQWKWLGFRRGHIRARRKLLRPGIGRRGKRLKFAAGLTTNQIAGYLPIIRAKSRRARSPST